ncbi:neuropeptide-like 3 [Copidosoma floridanum]|uniref:neuropeptide-like 3 n=1 Tax=Copidosoma floridanum TaxID=29053 RepID=UPI0006C94CAB|nr:neuropeptide-like 3 [Copidosoma floridanum]
MFKLFLLACVLAFAAAVPAPAPAPAPEPAPEAKPGALLAAPVFPAGYIAPAIPSYGAPLPAAYAYTYGSYLPYYRPSYLF